MAHGDVNIKCMHSFISFVLAHAAYGTAGVKTSCDSLACVSIVCTFVSKCSFIVMQLGFGYEFVYFLASLHSFTYSLVQIQPFPLRTAAIALPVGLNVIKVTLQLNPVCNFHLE